MNNLDTTDKFKYRIFYFRESDNLVAFPEATPPLRRQNSDSLNELE